VDHLGAPGHRSDGRIDPDGTHQTQRGHALGLGHGQPAPVTRDGGGDMHPFEPEVLEELEETIHESHGEPPLVMAPDVCLPIMRSLQ
jgi:hypothetical protein